jgi:outer membrane protein
MATIQKKTKRKRAACTALFLSALLMFGSLRPARVAFAEEQDRLPSPKGGVFSPSRILAPYRQNTVQDIQGAGGFDLGQIMAAGKIKLSMSLLRKSVLGNNLDIAFSKFNTLYAETDILRAKGGGAPRGATGVVIPTGLFAGAIGAGVGDSGGGTTGTSAGGISGGARAVVVRSRGSYDPSLSLNLSIDRTTSPLNTIRVSGIPVVTTSTTALQTRYSQAFTTGSSISVAFNNQRQSSTQQYLLFNPNFVSSFSFSITQQVLNGFGRDINRRYMDVAMNERKITREAFRQQVITTLAQAASLYWDLVAAHENLQVAEKSLAVARQLYADNKMREEIGKLSYIDVVTAEAEIAARQRDLVIAQSAHQMREAELKNALSRKVTPELAGASVTTIDNLPEPADADIPKLTDAMNAAMENRPELRQAEANMYNQSVAIKFAKNLLKPTMVLFAQYTGSGLWGDRVIQDPVSGANIRLPGGMWDAWGQLRRFDYPDYAFGFSLTIPLANRSAQADNMRTRLEHNQSETALEQTKSRIGLEVRKAVIGLVQAKAQVEAARKAAGLSQQLASAEEEKLSSGVSTPYDVIRRQRDLVTAQFAEVQARVNYAKALVEIRRSIGVLDSE